MTPTSRGDRILRKASPTDEFWKHWEDHREAMQAAGIQVSVWPKGSNKWHVSWWQPLSPEVLAERAKALSASSATDAEITIPAPEGFSYLGYQKAGVQFMLDRFSKPPGSVYLGDEMGLGKTIQAIGLINYETKIQRALIICPSSLKFNWFKELRKWLTRKLSVGVAEGKTFPSTDIVIINFDILHNFEKSLSFFWDLIVIDEVHNLCNAKNRRSKCVFGYKPKRNDINKLMTERGCDKDTAFLALRKSPMNARRKLAMSGTPMVNRIKDLFPVLNWLNPEEWKDEFTFLRRYAAGERDHLGHWNFSGASHVDELKTRLRSTLLLRRLKKQVWKEMPLKLRKLVEIPNTLETSKAIRAESEKFESFRDQLEGMMLAAELAKISEDKAIYKNAVKALNEGVKVAFDEMALVRKETAIAKLPAVVAGLREILDGDETHKLIVFGHHREVLLRLKQEFPQAAIIIGGMSAEEKSSQVEKFQNDKACNLFIGGLRAAAEGITLTASSHVIFIEEDWTPSRMTQAEDRAHRIGQHDNVLVEHWVLANSLDVNIVIANITKQEMMDTVLDEAAKAEIGEASVIPSKMNLLTGSAKVEQAKETATFEALQKAAAVLTPAMIEAIRGGIVALADQCAEALTPFDGKLISQLLAKPLTPKAAILARKVCLQYQKHFPPAMLAKIKGEQAK